MDKYAIKKVLTEMREDLGPISDVLRKNDRGDLADALVLRVGMVHGWMIGLVPDLFSEPHVTLGELANAQNIYDRINTTQEPA